jgi:ABC-type transporter Mla maintaining outer membrane lipid asymmetry ATPase subunit MlaF
VLLLEDVTVDIGGQRLLDRVRLAVRRGERFGVVAPTPGEQATILSLLAGRRAPTAGRVRIDGLDPVDDAELLTGRVAEDPQEPGTADVLLVTTPPTSAAAWSSATRADDDAGTPHAPRPTVLLVTADAAQARAVCDRVAVLADGRVVATFPTSANPHTHNHTHRPPTTRSTS